MHIEESSAVENPPAVITQTILKYFREAEVDDGLLRGLISNALPKNVTPEKLDIRHHPS